MTILPAWRSVLKRSVLKRSASVWAGYAQALLGVLTFLDPGIALAVWNQMPASVSSRVPPAFISAVGAILFGLAMLTIALHLFAQPKLNASIERKEAMTAITWGQTLTPSPAQLVEMKRRKLVKDSTSIRLTTKPGSEPAKANVTTWGAAGFFANAVGIQFPTGDPAYAAMTAFLQGTAR